MVADAAAVGDAGADDVCSQRTGRMPVSADARVSSPAHL